MKWEELLNITGDMPVFSSAFLFAGRASISGVRRQLDRWVKSGRIFQLRRGVYAVSLPYRNSAPHPFLVANHLRKPSYVSLQSALSHYGMIPEFVPVTTSVSTGRPEELQTPLGRFIFRHVKKSIFFGYAQTEIAQRLPVFLATPEKALLDLLYLTPGSDSSGYLEELRFEPTNDFDWPAFQENAERMESRKLKRAVKVILRMAGKTDFRERGK
jgi:predicted transcriptional regulator of viral defense system